MSGFYPDFTNGGVYVKNLPLTAFRSSVSVEELTPIVQLKFDLGQEDELDEFSLGDSSITVSNGMLEVSSGTIAGAFAAATSKRTVVYRAGTGLEWKGTGLYSAPILGISQYIGFIGATDSILIGYNSDQEFGVLRFHHGACHIEELTVSAGTGVSSEIATVTISGTAYNVNLAANLSASQVAYEIANSLNSQIQDWRFDSVGNKVRTINVFVTDPVNVDVFDYSGTVSVATWTEIEAGKDGETDFTTISDWNIKSDFPVNPQMLTPFRITMQYLGGGAIEFYAENARTGALDLVHRIRYAGSATQPSVRSPSFRVGAVAINNAAPGLSLNVKTASLQGSIQGRVLLDSPSKAYISPPVTVGATLTNVLTIRNREEFASTKNLAEIFLNIVTATSDSGKATQLLVIKNAVALEPLVFQYRNEASGLALISSTGADIDSTQGEQIDAQSFIGTSNQLNLRTLNQTLAAGETLTIAMRVSSGPESAMTASLTWFDDK